MFKFFSGVIVGVWISKNYPNEVLPLQNALDDCVKFAMNAKVIKDYQNKE
jgi:hypothetical protein